MKGLPLLVAGGAALFLIGGGKKKKTSTKSTTTTEEEPPVEADEEEVDEGEGPAPTEEEEKEEYGKVASGKRSDRIGSHSWRIEYLEDGYHAQIMQGPQKFAPIQEEVGVTASLKAAKELLRDHFNQALAAAGYPESDFKDDPAPSAPSRGIKMA